jgi:formate hydrogenlyase transcriptional activator
MLVWHYVKKYAQQMNKQVENILPEDMEALVHHGWPGNVRELQNIIERSMVVSAGGVLAISCPAGPKSTDISTGTRTLAEAEREHIRKALRATNWVLGGPEGAATRLGVKRTTLLSKIKRLGLSRNGD